jgi:hypothetical protein
VVDRDGFVFCDLTAAPETAGDTRE